jgi:HAD superfamily phosphoserine phosphatase-like hydrolase
MIVPSMSVPAGTHVAAFACVVLDVDSTLSSIEGIEWLAERRGPAIARQIAAMTDRAMAGDVPLDAVYGQRLALVRPTRAEIEALASAYVRGIMPGARDALETLRERGVYLTIVSGGLREAILPLAGSLGIDEDDVHAVSVDFADDGSYLGFDTGSPLARRGGKPAVVGGLQLPRPVLALGDGSTDAELKTAPSSNGPVVDAFAAFIGVARRPAVVAVADYVVPAFDALPPIVLGAHVP